jgi:hypothetical protein
VCVERTWGFHIARIVHVYLYAADRLWDTQGTAVDYGVCLRATRRSLLFISGHPDLIDPNGCSLAEMFGAPLESAGSARDPSGQMVGNWDVMHSYVGLGRNRHMTN